MRAAAKRPRGFLNVDFDVESRHPLGDLTALFDVVGLFQVNAYRRGGLWCAGFEMARTYSTAERTIAAMLNAIANGARRARNELRRCTSGSVNVGYEASGDRFEDRLSSGIVRRLAILDIDVEITMYPAEKRVRTHR